MLRRCLAGVLILLCCACSQAQPWTDIDKALAEENVFKARFYLQQKQGSTASSESAFAFRNQLIESFLLDRSQKDSVQKLLAANRTSVHVIKDSKSKEHFAWLEAWSMQANNQPDNAYQLLTNIKARSVVNQAAVLYRMADLERNSYRRFPEGQAHIQEAIRLYQQDSTLFYFKLYRCRVLLGLLYRDQNNNISAEQHYRLALNILDHIPEPKYDERARILNNLGNLHRTNYGKAKVLYEESLALRQQYVKDSLSLANAYTNLGVFYLNFGNLPVAQDLLENALTYSTVPGNNYNILVYNYGLLLNEFYEFAAARDRIERAIAKSSGILPAHHVSVIRLRLLLAQEYCFLQNFAEAERQLSIARSALKQYPDTEPLRVNYFSVMALLEFHEKDYEPMKAYADTAVVEYQRLKMNDPVLETDVLKRKADAAMQTRDWSGAKHGYRALRETLLSYQSPQSRDVILADVSMGEAFMNENHTDSAVSLFRRALQSIRAGSADSTSYLTERIMANTKLADALYQNFTKHGKPEDLKLAAFHINESVSLVTSHKQHIGQQVDKLGFGRIFYEVFPLAIDIAYRRYQQEPGLPAAEEFFRYLEQSRVQVLLNSIREMKIRQFAGVTTSIVAYENAMEERERQLRQTLEVLLTKTDPEIEILDGVKGELLSMEGRKKHFIDSIRLHLPDYYNLKYNETTTTLAQLQSLLASQPGKAMMVYGAGQTDLYGLLITARGIQLESCAPWALIRSNAKRFRNQLRLQQDQSVVPTSLLLNQQLLEKFTVKSALAGISTLVVVPDDNLIHLPFEALMKKQGHRAPQYLIEDFDIVYSYSGTLFWQKSTDKPWQQQDKRFLGFAPTFVSSVRATESDPVRGAASSAYETFQFDELPGARHEVETIQNAFRKKKRNTQTYFGPVATESEFKTSALKDYAYIHLATHGFADTRDNGLVGVAFYAEDNEKEDGLLLAGEVYGLNLNAQLVMLSACETGLGDQVKGEGVMGLSRAFIYAGVRSVVASLWKVEDKATVDLMTTFYEQGILRNRLPSESLRKAKLTMIHKGHHPYQWASFVLIGTP